MSAGRHQAAALCLATALMAATATAGGASPPPTLAEIQAATTPSGADTPAFGTAKRRASMRLAALRYATQAGLARRSWELHGTISRHAASLSRIYDFRALLIRVDGFDVDPPVLAETRRAFRLGDGGAGAASAGRVLRLLAPARPVTAAPDWRDYLLRAWAPAQAPAEVLFPRGREEEALWRDWLAEGWRRGRDLADDILASSLARLNRDFEGRLLWHGLRAQGLVSAPRLAAGDVAASGHARLLRIGERSLRIDAAAAFQLDPRRWTPAPVVPAAGRADEGAAP